MARIFISYKRVDKDKVFEIKDKVESFIGKECWIDLDGIESDAQFINVIIKAINNAEIVLFMYSKAHSRIVDFEKDWTVRELNYAAKRNKRIVFVNIDNSSLTDEFEFLYGTKQQIDGTSEESLLRLINDLKKWLDIIYESKDLKDEQPKVQENFNSDELCYGALSTKELLNFALTQNIEACKEIAFRYYSGTNGCKKNISMANKFLNKVGMSLFLSSEDLTNEIYSYIPKILCFMYEDKPIRMFLSPNKKFFLANINKTSSEISWLNEGWISQTNLSPASFAIGSAIVSVFNPMAAMPLMIAKILKDSKDKKDNSKDAIQNKIIEVCQYIQKTYGYNLDFPTRSELQHVKDEETKQYCIVLRIEDNPNLTCKYTKL